MQEELKGLRHKHNTRLAIFVAVICIPMILLGLHIFSGHSLAISFHGKELKSVRHAWLLDGSPEHPLVEKYTNATNSTRHIYVQTNSYALNGKVYRSLFGLSAEDLDDKGTLVVTKDGQLIWNGIAGNSKLVEGD